MSKERRLGRGLEALLGKVATQQADRNAQQHSAESHQAPADEPEAATASLYVVYPSSDSEGDQAAAVQEAPQQEESWEPQIAPETEFCSTETAIAPPTDAPAPTAPTAVPAGPARLPIGNIDANPHQPRRDFDDAELERLAGSLREHGLLQPIVVRRLGDRYQIVAGERRLRAAMTAGWNDVPVQIVEADDRQMAELAIVENLQRKDLNAIEKAASFRNYLEEYACTQEELAARLQIDRSTVANLIRLLELPETVRESLRAGRITQGHARALLPLGEEQDQVDFCQRIEGERWSVRETEAAVQDFLRGGDLAAELGLVGGTTGDKHKRTEKSDHLAVLEQEFRSALGAKVTLKANARGRGKIVIPFTNHDDFERIRALLCDPSNQVNRAG